MQTSGVESIHASAIGVTRFVAPGPTSRSRHRRRPTPARSPPPCGRRPARGAPGRAGRTSRGRTRRTRQDRAARDPERDAHALVLERAKDGVGAEHPRHGAQTLEHLDVRPHLGQQLEHGVGERSACPDARPAAPPPTARSSVRAADRRWSPSASSSDRVRSIAAGSAMPKPARSSGAARAGTNSPGPRPRATRGDARRRAPRWAAASVERLKSCASVTTRRDRLRSTQPDERLPDGAVLDGMPPSARARRRRRARQALDEPTAVSRPCFAAALKNARSTAAAATRSPTAPNTATSPAGPRGTRGRATRGRGRPSAPRPPARAGSRRGSRRPCGTRRASRAVTDGRSASSRRRRTGGAGRRARASAAR